MLAPQGWRTGQVSEGAYSLLLIDWEFSIEAKSNAALNGGTPVTMSQGQLEGMLQYLDRKVTDSQLGVDLDGALDAKPGDPTEGAVPFGVEDELESAVKSILLILSSSLKRRLKQEATNTALQVSSRVQRRPFTPLEKDLMRRRRMFQHIRDVWARVMPAEVLELSARHDYMALAKWLTTKLLHFDPAEMPSQPF
jgi:hypothetical protein